MAYAILRMMIVLIHVNAARELFTAQLLDVSQR
jgi:hypothetical protein